MVREDITKLAREAGIKNDCDGIWCDADQLIAFAALVAAAEREKVAAWMIQRGYATGHGDTTEDLLNELNWQIAERIAAEREACAKAAEEYMRECEGASFGIGEAIRARGQA